MRAGACCWRGRIGAEAPPAHCGLKSPAQAARACSSRWPRCLASCAISWLASMKRAGPCGARAGLGVGDGGVPEGRRPQPPRHCGRGGLLGLARVAGARARPRPRRICLAAPQTAPAQQPLPACIWIYARSGCSDAARAARCACPAMSDLPCTPRRYLWTAKLRPGRAWRRGARAGARAQAFLYNPGNFGTPTQLSWASLTGQNFTAQHNSPHIDFCGAHFWPDRWVRARCRAVAHARAGGQAAAPRASASTSQLCCRARVAQGSTCGGAFPNKLLRRASRAWLSPATEPRHSRRKLGLGLAEAMPGLG